MFNPPPADLRDLEPLIHLASPADFWYRSYRIGNSPIFFGRSKSRRWDSPDGDFGVLYLGGDVCLYRIYWPWSFEDAVCTQRSAESHRVGQDSLHADLASDRYGHVWRSDTPWSGEQPDERIRLQEFAAMVSSAQRASLKTRWDLLPLAS